MDKKELTKSLPPMITNGMLNISSSQNFFKTSTGKSENDDILSIKAFHNNSSSPSNHSTLSPHNKTTTISHENVPPRPTKKKSYLKSNEEYFNENFKKISQISKQQETTEHYEDVKSSPLQFSNIPKNSTKNNNINKKPPALPPKKNLKNSMIVTNSNMVIYFCI